MNRARVLVALLAIAAVGASGTLHAQARGSLPRKARSDAQQVERPPLVLDEATRASRIAEMEAWLGRLVGQFRVDATRTRRDPFAQRDVVEERTGTAKRSAIGDGPGVRCTIRLIEPPPVEPPLVKLSPHLSSVTWPNLVQAQPILHLGINPDTLEIHAVVVHVGWVAARSGLLAGDSVDFSVDNWKDCQRILFETCWVVSEITAEPEGEVSMTIFVDGNGARTASGHTSEIGLHLHHEPLADAKMPQGLGFGLGAAGAASIKLHNYEGNDWREARRAVLEVFDGFKEKSGGASVKEVSENIDRHELDLILRQTLGAADAMNNSYAPQYMVLTFDMTSLMQPAGGRLHCQWVYNGKDNTYSVALFQDLANAPRRDMEANTQIRKPWKNVWGT